MQTDNFIVYIKTDDILKDIGEDVEIRFDISNYQMPLSDTFTQKKKKKEVIGLMKNGLGCEIMTKYVGIRGKTYSSLIDDNSEDKKAKRHKGMCHKRKN